MMYFVALPLVGDDILLFRGFYMNVLCVQLLKATESGRVDHMRELLDEGADVQYKNKVRHVS
jgi:hypothetical protein